MLSLRRRKGETLVFAHPALSKDITVSIGAIEHNGTRVKIGVDAPRSVRIVRGELLPWKEMPEQSPCSAQPKTKIWYAADRAKAMQASGPQGRAYIQELEIIARLADAIYISQSHRARTPEEEELFEQLLDALSRVNFLAKDDQTHTDKATEEDELPRDVIFS